MKNSPVQLEGVGAVTVRRLLLQVLGQVDDHDGLKGALLQQGNERQAGSSVGSLMIKQHKVMIMMA